MRAISAMNRILRACGPPVNPSPRLGGRENRGTEVDGRRSLCTSPLPPTGLLTVSGGGLGSGHGVLCESGGPAMNRSAKRKQEKEQGRQGFVPAGDTRTLQLALQHHQAGRLSEAEALYRRVLGADPRNPDALHLLGLIAQQTGQNRMAADLISQALAVKPNEARLSQKPRRRSGVAGAHAGSRRCAAPRRGPGSKRSRYRRRARSRIDKDGPRAT